MELDPVDECFIVDGTGMSGPPSKGFKIRFAGPAYVGLVDGTEWDQFDRVDFDLAVAHAVPTTRFYLGPAPQPERDRDVTRQHARTKFPAELHGQNVGQFAVDPDQDACLRSWSESLIGALGLVACTTPSRPGTPCQQLWTSLSRGVDSRAMPRDTHALAETGNERWPPLLQLWGLSFVLPFLGLLGFPWVI